MTNSKNNSRKVYCSYGHIGESNWITPLGFTLTHNIEEADVVVFGGGKDVDPGFYGEKRGSQTDPPSLRDRAEKKDFEHIQSLIKQGKKVKSVGVCRGAQLLCALSGGKLIQDVTNHFGAHEINTYDKQVIRVNSIHHQMLYPYNLKKNEYKILGWSTKNLSSNYLNGFNKPIWLPEGFKEIEMAYFKNTDSLAIQCHPEMMFRSTEEKSVETVKWIQDLFLKFYNNELQ